MTVIAYKRTETDGSERVSLDYLNPWGRLATRVSSGDREVNSAAPKPARLLIKELGETDSETLQVTWSETPEEHAARAITKWIEPAGGYDSIVITDAQADALQQDRDFREALEIADGDVGVSMEKAREIHMARIRKARDAEFPALDVAYTKADEAGDDAAKQEIAAKRQALRDIPENIDLSAATTPDALRTLWPSDLPRG